MYKQNADGISRSVDLARAYILEHDRAALLPYLARAVKWVISDGGVVSGDVVLRALAGEETHVIDSSVWSFDAHICCDAQHVRSKVIELLRALGASHGEHHAIAYAHISERDCMATIFLRGRLFARINFGMQSARAVPEGRKVAIYGVENVPTMPIAYLVSSLLGVLLRTQSVGMWGAKLMLLHKLMRAQTRAMPMKHAPAHAPAPAPAREEFAQMMSDEVIVGARAVVFYAKRAGFVCTRATADACARGIYIDEYVSSDEAIARMRTNAGGRFHILENACPVLLPNDHRQTYSDIVVGSEGSADSSNLLARVHNLRAFEITPVVRDEKRKLIYGSPILVLRLLLDCAYAQAQSDVSASTYMDLALEMHALMWALTPSTLFPITFAGTYTLEHLDKSTIRPHSTSSGRSDASARSCMVSADPPSAVCDAYRDALRIVRDEKA